VYVAACLFGFCSGAKSLADTERLNDDEALKALLGFTRFPDQSALGEWLRNIGQAGVGELRLLLRDFGAWALKRTKPEMVRHAEMLEAFFDDTQIEVDGKCFEGAKINYDGNLALSWQTLFVGPFLVDALMGRYFEAIDDFFERWSVSYNKWTGPLEEQSAALPQKSWSAPEYEKWRDGSQHETQYSWLRYQPGGCEKPSSLA
jgi:hypothetical protein